ncbi:hypothetical protein [Nocardioides sp. TF02-7]|uniref:hypothetical protein n=1 Tax=Nocardioides sp. TF02-7 TaxID=2917724 RepID=UPI001F058DA9|nr:hypothetical protein [Nocardioides sp. TF02-7]UMG94426.1 hypothetical protein MF408_10825 [Nocardioides sp. TF02-7]
MRRAHGAPVAVVAALPLGRAATLDAACRRLVAPVVAHAREHDLADRAVLTPFQLVLAPGEPEPDVVRVRNAAALQRCGVSNPRVDLVVDLDGSGSEQAVLAAYGYREVASLRRTARGVPVAVWVADAGPGGLAGLLHDAVRTEHGHPPHEGPGPGEALLAALEGFHDDTVLAALAVAPPDVAPRRAAERVRSWVRESVERLLADEPALLDLVTRRYVAPGATHEGVMRATYTSRATYFRRLRRARDLLSAGQRTPHE